MYFEKQATLWESSDIEKLAGTEEGVYLEFKKPSEFVPNGTFSREMIAKELTETVSAFLNSDGGVILFGVQTDRNKTDKKIELLKPFKAWSSDNTLEHLGISYTVSQIRDLIYGNIVPKPTGIDVKSISVPTANAVTTIFIITVERSALGAHQSAKTMRYYRRTGEGDVPMLDFEIRDVNSRRAGPLLYLACKVSDTAGIPFEEEWKKSVVDMERDSRGQNIYRVNFVVAASNFGRGTASIARFDIGLPTPWQVENYSPDGTNVGAYWVPKSGLQYSVGNRIIVFWTPGKCPDIPLPYRGKKISEQMVAWQQVIYSVADPPAHPIWPNSGRRVIGVLRLQRQNNGNVTPFLWLPWRAFAGDMPETRGAVLLLERADKLYVFNYEMDDVSWWHHAEDEGKFEALKQKFGVK